MNIPRFNLDALPVGVDDSYIHAVIREEERVCGPIDNRLRELEKEFCKLVAQAKVLRDKIKTIGFFEGWGGVRHDLADIEDKIDINQGLRQTLYNARWRNTYG